MVLFVSFNTCSSCEEQHQSPTFSVLPMCFNTCSSCEEQQIFDAQGVMLSGFNTCSSCEEQRECRRGGRRTASFNTCSSCEEQPEAVSVYGDLDIVSIHAPLARSNLVDPRRWICMEKFQYMLLLRGATRDETWPAGRLLRFNTCSSCEEQRRTWS